MRCPVRGTPQTCSDAPMIQSIKLLFPSFVLGAALLGVFSQAQNDPFAIPADQKAKIAAALPEKAPAPVGKKHSVLVFSRTTGFRHSSIPTGVECMKQMGEKTGLFAVTHSEDPAAFEADSLKKYDAVIFMNTTGEPLKSDEAGAEDRRKKALLDFVKSGKGLIGMHAATDTYKDWKEYTEMMGGAFESHPWGSGDTVKVRLVDAKHPVNAGFGGEAFTIKDEIYKFRPETASPEGRRMLLALDPDGTNMGKDSKDGKPARDFYPIAWVSKFGEGRTFYCSLGHNEHVYATPAVLQHYLAGIQYALGELAADATPVKVARLNESGALEIADR